MKKIDELRTKTQKLTVDFMKMDTVKEIKEQKKQKLKWPEMAFCYL